MLQKVLYSLRLFVVGGEHITMAIVVMADMCVQKYHGHTYYYQQFIGCCVPKGAL